MTDTVCHISQLSTCSFNDALQAWNEGFQGYFVDMSSSLDKFLSRLQSESLSPEYSFLAFCEGRPAGILLNGIRSSDDVKVAWNGGTGVSPEFRGRGVGTALMRTTLDFYKRNSVQTGTLESISENERAIALYHNFGYQITDRLVFLEHEGSLDSFSGSDTNAYSVQHVPPQRVGRLDFYDTTAAWQAQWQSLAINNGEAVIVKDRSGTDVGYVLYKRRLDDAGEVSSIALYQCVPRGGVLDREGVVRAALEKVYAPARLECRRTTYNLRVADNVVVEILTRAGFKNSIEQVHMKVSLENA
jgi:ribosomal protein S18 acetylase RimI-like enzyme